MAEEKGSATAPSEPAAEPKPAATKPAATPKRRRTTERTASGAAAPPAPAKKAPAPKAPRRPTLEPETRRLLAEREGQRQRRPRFDRQQAYRYWSLGRWQTWRRPRGQQSKQRRHYGYRSTIVSIGFGSPRAVRGRTPSGFVPVVVATAREIEALEPIEHAAIIARTVGTRRRLVLEEVARKRGLHVLNPLLREREAT